MTTAQDVSNIGHLTMAASALNTIVHFVVGDPHTLHYAIGSILVTAVLLAGYYLTGSVAQVRWGNALAWVVLLSAALPLGSRLILSGWQ